jgi:ATP-binding cassette subfamily F protein 3
VIDFLTRHTGRESWFCGKVSARFQLKKELLNARKGELPWGTSTRVKLAAMLIREPDMA